MSSTSVDDLVMVERLLDRCRGVVGKCGAHAVSAR